MTFQTDLSSTCMCCADLLRGGFSRRRFMQGAAAAGAMMAMPAPVALAASGNYDAMVLGCIDPRLQEPMHRYTARRGLTGKFSQFIIAGAVVGVVAEPFKDWHKAFWDNLAITVQLHKIKRVIGLTHRDCGAAFVAYGEALRTDKALETAKQSEALRQFRAGVGQRHPTLAVDTGIMDLNGAVEVVA